jgi:transcriptional regulator NrdR family protein
MVCIYWLYTDLLEALQDRKDRYVAAREVTSTIVQKVQKNTNGPLFSTKLISKTAAEILKRFDKRAYLRYAAEHPSLQ